MTDKYNTRLDKGSKSFSDMMSNGFGIVTVMNAKVYDYDTITTGDSSIDLENKTAYGIVSGLKAKKPICVLDTLKVANVTIEGPSKTVTGGQFASPLLKYGKTARLEMQDALGDARALDVFGGGVREIITTTETSYDEAVAGEYDADGKLTSTIATTTGVHFGEDFNKPVIILGDSFFIDRKTQQQVPVKIIFYKFLPDSIFNLTQDAEGDASVFDLNGDLLIQKIVIGDKDGGDDTTGEGTTHSIQHGVFYSIVDPSKCSAPVSLGE